MTLEREKLTAATVFTGELAQRGHWIVACIEPQLTWPTSVQKLEYRGHSVLVLPQFDDFYPSMAVRLGKGINTRRDAQVLISNLLSALSWVQGRGALVQHWTGGSSPRPYGGFPRAEIGMTLTDHFRFHYLPDVADQKTRWALAFFREGLSIRHPPYAFLSFYKIVNILHKSGARQKIWINGSVDKAVSQRSKERLDQLRSSNSDVGQYLYASGRCAVAHAGQGQTVDPEDPLDLERLTHDLPVMRDLAAHAIEFEFGVKSSAAVYREHLYELEGFRCLVGKSLCYRLKALDVVNIEEMPVVPPLRIGLWGEDEYAPFSKLNANVKAIEKGIVYMECIAENGRTKVLIGLDFPDERLLIDAFDYLDSLDDGTEAAVRDAIAVVKFQRAYFRNGELVVERADTGHLMARCDAFIATNVDMAATDRNFQARIDRLTEIAEERAAKPAERE